MFYYNYKVRDKAGVLVQGRLKAVSSDEAGELLRSASYSIIEIKPISELEQLILNFFTKIKKVKQKEILLFSRQLSSMIHAGLPILTSLENITKQTQNPKLQAVLKQVHADVEAGTTFTESLKKHPKFFPKFFTSMINVGEISGKLDEILSRLVFIGTQEMEVRTRIVSAVAYPVILLGLSVSVITLLLIFVLPKFVTVYKSFNVELPLPTKILLNTSSLLQNYWPLMIVLIGLVIAGLRQYLKTTQGRFNFDNLLFKLPIFGALILKYNLSRFTRTLGSLVKSGIPIMQGLSVVESTIGNQVLCTVISDLKGSILEGKSLSNQLKLNVIFPPMVIQMIATGEQTGKLDEMLIEIADFYDIEVDYEIRNLTSVLEPLLLILMGGAVLFMALAVLTPIFNLNSLAG